MEENKRLSTRSQGRRKPLRRQSIGGASDCEQWFAPPMLCLLRTFWRLCTIRILSALRMRGLYDKRHLLAKLCIAGSKNSHGLSSNFNSVAKIDDSSSSMQIIVNTEQCWTQLHTHTHTHTHKRKFLIIYFCLPTCRILGVQRNG